MKITDPFLQGAFSASELYRQTRDPLQFAMGQSIGHADNLKRLMEQIEGPLRAIRQMPTDPNRDILDNVFTSIRTDAGLSGTMRAIEQAQKERELFVRTLAGTDVLRTRELATIEFDTGILRTAERIGRNGDTIASAIAATRPRDELTGLTASIIRRMDMLRLAGLQPDIFPRSTVDLFTKQFSKARRVAEKLDRAETEEERAALIVKLIAIIAAALKSVSITKKDAVIWLSFTLAVIGLTADIKSLLPSEPPSGMSAAQVRVLEETHDDVDTLLKEFGRLRASEHTIDEAYVADLPRAVLNRPAVIRSEPRGDGRALFKAPAGTLLAIDRSEGRWKHAVYRDPLTDQLALAWVFGPAVTALDEQ